MKRILALICVFALILPTFLMIGCAEQEQKQILRICNCEDYIDETLFEDFYNETGITIEYSTYGTNENLYNELVINPNSYDLVVPSEYMIENLAVEGRINKLDLSKVTDYTSNVSDFIKTKLEDKTFKVTKGEYEGQTASISEYMVGYMWGTMGWVYNIDNVSVEDVNSWYSPFENADLSKKITIKDAVRDSYIVGLAMVYEDELKLANNNITITEILNRTSKQHVDKVGEKLNSLRPMLYGFEVDSGKNDIVLGNIDAYVAWSGDAAYAIDVAAGEVEDEDGTFVENIRNLSYYIPDEGSNIWFDGFCMPSGSNNYDAVYKFLNFISRPENVFRNMDYTGYTSMVAGEEIFNDVFLDWFDESEYLAMDMQENDEFADKDIEELLQLIENMTEQELVDYGYGLADLDQFRYFFGDIVDNYRLVISEESYGRLIAQYPNADKVERCAIMSYFDGETLMVINEMWEGVKGQTIPTVTLVAIFIGVVILAILIVLYRHRDKIKWFKLPERKTTYAQRKGYKLVKKEKLN